MKSKFPARKKKRKKERKENTHITYKTSKGRKHELKNAYIDT